MCRALCRIQDCDRNGVCCVSTDQWPGLASHPFFIVPIHFHLSHDIHSIGLFHFLNLPWIENIYLKFCAPSQRPNLQTQFCGFYCFSGNNCTANAKYHCHVCEMTQFLCKCRKSDIFSNIADSYKKKYNQLSDEAVGWDCCGTSDLTWVFLQRRVEPSWEEVIANQTLPDSPSWPHLAAPTSSFASTSISSIISCHHHLALPTFTQDCSAVYKSNFQPICFQQSWRNPILKLTRSPYIGNWQSSSFFSWVGAPKRCATSAVITYL